jgi:hypothetical protein
MANTKRVQLRKGTELEHSTFTGALAEVTFDTDKGTIRVHDGLTLSGVEIQKSRLTDLSPSNDGDTLRTNIKYFGDTSTAPFAVYLPTLRFVGDTIHLADSKYTWNINNLTVYAQGGDQIKDGTGFIDTFLNCDVAGAYVELIWEGTYWRLFT